MRKLALVIALLTISTLIMGAGVTFAQTPAGPAAQPTTATNDVENWTIKQWNNAKREWVKDKAKWADCRQQSTKQKLAGRKSWSFLYTCMEKQS